MQALHNVFRRFILLTEVGFVPHNWRKSLVLTVLLHVQPMDGDRPAPEKESRKTTAAQQPLRNATAARASGDAGQAEGDGDAAN